MHLVIFPFSSSPECLEEGGVPARNHSMSCFLLKTQGNYWPFSFCSSERTLVQSCTLLVPISAASQPSLFTPCAPGGSRIPNQQEPDVWAPGLSWNISAQEPHLNSTELLFPFTHRSLPLNITGLQSSSAGEFLIKWRASFLFHIFYFKFHSWEIPSLTTQPCLTAPMETQFAEELSSNPVFE